MTKIKFIYARFADPDENEFALKRRFEWHLRKLRALQDGVSPKVPGDFEYELRWNEDLIAVPLSEKDRNKVLRRARRVMGARAKAFGLSHLSADDRRALEVFRGGADLIGIVNEHRADEIAAAIHAEMPWMAAATDFLSGPIPEPSGHPAPCRPQQRGSHLLRGARGRKTGAV
jgi:hypothetical protein